MLFLKTQNLFKSLPRVRTVLALSTAALFCLLTGFTSQANNCAIQLAGDEIPNYGIIESNDPAIRSFIKQRRLEALKQKLPEIRSSHPGIQLPSPGDDIDYFGEAYKVTAVLGAGKDGIVYQVRFNNQLGAIKIYFIKSQRDKVDTLFKILEEKGIPTINNLGKYFDFPTSTARNVKAMLYQYIEGVTLHDALTYYERIKLVEDNVLKKKNELDSYIESKIRKDSLEWQTYKNITSELNSSPVDSDTLIDDFNIVYDIANDRLVIIDPY